MAQVFDPVPSDHPSRVLCCYVNATSKIQIVRITNIENWYFERVVFPGQRLIFEALASAQLEVHSGAMASAILSDTIPCQRLQVNQGQMEQGQTEAPSPGLGEPNSEPMASTQSGQSGTQSHAFRDGLAAARSAPTSVSYQPV